VEEQMVGEGASSSKWVYVFADQNPYVGHPNPLKEGQELFRRGLLSEAVLALEAEVLKNPDNSEGWRFLGITHAENDDDKQVRLMLIYVQGLWWEVCPLWRVGMHRCTSRRRCMSEFFGWNKVLVYSNLKFS
jgi:hypothetical protein